MQSGSISTGATVGTTPLRAPATRSASARMIRPGSTASTVLESFRSLQEACNQMMEETQQNLRAIENSTRMNFQSRVPFPQTQQGTSLRSNVDEEPQSELIPQRTESRVEYATPARTSRGHSDYSGAPPSRYFPVPPRNIPPYRPAPVIDAAPRSVSSSSMAMESQTSASSSYQAPTTHENIFTIEQSMYLAKQLQAAQLETRRLVEDSIQALRVRIETDNQLTKAEQREVRLGIHRLIEELGNRLEQRLLASSQSNATLARDVEDLITATRAHKVMFEELESVMVGRLTAFESSQESFRNSLTVATTTASRAQAQCERLAAECANLQAERDELQDNQARLEAKVAALEQTLSTVIGRLSALPPALFVKRPGDGTRNRGRDASNWLKSESVDLNDIALEALPDKSAAPRSNPPQSDQRDESEQDDRDPDEDVVDDELDATNFLMQGDLEPRLRAFYDSDWAVRRRTQQEETLITKVKSLVLPEIQKVSKLAATAEAGAKLAQQRADDAGDAAQKAAEAAATVMHSVTTLDAAWSAKLSTIEQNTESYHALFKKHSEDTVAQLASALSLSSTVQRLEKSVADLSSRTLGADARITSVMERANQVDSRAESIETHLFALSSKFAETSSRFDTAIAQLQDKSESLVIRAEAAAARAEALTRSNDQLESVRSELAAELTRQAAAARTTELAYSKRVKALEDRINALSGRIENTEAVLNTSSADLSFASASQSFEKSASSKSPLPSQLSTTTPERGTSLPSVAESKLEDELKRVQEAIAELQGVSQEITLRINELSRGSSEIPEINTQLQVLKSEIDDLRGRLAEESKRFDDETFKRKLVESLQKELDGKADSIEHRVLDHVKPCVEQMVATQIELHTSTLSTSIRVDLESSLPPMVEGQVQVSLENHPKLQDLTKQLDLIGSRLDEMASANEDLRHQLGDLASHERQHVAELQAELEDVKKLQSAQEQSLTAALPRIEALEDETVDLAQRLQASVRAMANEIGTLAVSAAATASPNRKDESKSGSVRNLSEELNAARSTDEGSDGSAESVGEVSSEQLQQWSRRLDELEASLHRLEQHEDELKQWTQALIDTKVEQASTTLTTSLEAKISQESQANSQDFTAQLSRLMNRMEAQQGQESANLSALKRDLLSLKGEVDTLRQEFEEERLQCAESGEPKAAGASAPIPQSNGEGDMPQVQQDLENLKRSLDSICDQLSALDLALKERLPDVVVATDQTGGEGPTPLVKLCGWIASVQEQQSRSDALMNSTLSKHSEIILEQADTVQKRLAEHVSKIATLEASQLQQDKEMQEIEEKIKSMSASYAALERDVTDRINAATSPAAGLELLRRTTHIQSAKLDKLAAQFAEISPLLSRSFQRD